MKSRQNSPQQFTVCMLLSFLFNEFLFVDVLRSESGSRVHRHKGTGGGGQSS